MSNRHRSIVAGRYAMMASAAIAAAQRKEAEQTFTPTQAMQRIAEDQHRDEMRRWHLRRSKRAAVNDLVRASQASLVLAHIHPRWLRERVAATIDAGHDVTEADIARWRAEGER